MSESKHLEENVEFTREQASARVIKEATRLSGQPEFDQDGLDALMDYLSKTYGSPKESIYEDIRELEFATGKRPIKLAFDRDSSDLIGFSLPISPQVIIASQSRGGDCSYYKAQWAVSIGSALQPITFPRPAAQLIINPIFKAIARLNAIRKLPRVERRVGNKLCRNCNSPCTCGWWRQGVFVGTATITPVTSVTLPVIGPVVVLARVRITVFAWIRAYCG